MYTFLKSLFDKRKISRETVKNNSIHRQLYDSFRKYQEFTKKYYDEIKKSSDPQDQEDFQIIENFRFMNSLNKMYKLLEKLKPDEESLCTKLLGNGFNESTNSLSNSKDLSRRKIKSCKKDDEEIIEKPKKRLKTSRDSSKLISIVKDSPDKNNLLSKEISINKKVSTKLSKKQNATNGSNKTKLSSKLNQNILKLSVPENLKRSTSNSSLHDFKIPKKPRLDANDKTFDNMTYGSIIKPASNKQTTVEDDDWNDEFDQTSSEPSSQVDSMNNNINKSNVQANDPLYLSQSMLKGDLPNQSYNHKDEQNQPRVAFRRESVIVTPNSKSSSIYDSNRMSASNLKPISPRDPRIKPSQMRENLMVASNSESSFTNKHCENESSQMKSFLKKEEKIESPRQESFGDDWDDEPSQEMPVKMSTASNSTPSFTSNNNYTNKSNQIQDVRVQDTKVKSPNSSFENDGRNHFNQKNYSPVNESNLVSSYSSNGHQNNSSSQMQDNKSDSSFFANNKNLKKPTENYDVRFVNNNNMNKPGQIFDVRFLNHNSGQSHQLQNNKMALPNSSFANNNYVNNHSPTFSASDERVSKPESSGNNWINQESKSISSAMDDDWD